MGTTYYGTISDGVEVADSRAEQCNYTVSVSEAAEIAETLFRGLGWFMNIKEEPIKIHDSMDVIGRWHVSILEKIHAMDLPFPGLLMLIQEDIHVHDFTPTWKYIAGAMIHESVKIKLTLSPQMRYRMAMSAAIKLKDIIQRVYPVSITQHVTVFDLHKIVLGISVMDRMKVLDHSAPSFRYTMQMFEAIIIDEALARFWGASIYDSIGLVSTVSPFWRFPRTIDEEIEIADTIVPRLIIRLDMQDQLDISDNEVVRMIYRGDWLEDKFCITACFVDPGGGFTTWAINTRTSAVTEYKNFVFNSFAKMGHHYIGATSDGLYELDGPLDDTLGIPTRIKAGWMQLGGSKFTSFKAAYFGFGKVSKDSKDAPDFLLKLHAGDGRVYIYKLRPENMQTTKINMGKGLRARYFSWELITPGPDYDLESVEFVPIISKRRV